MHPFRTRFADDIVTEFLPPRKKSRRVIILCGGMPGVPAKKAVLEFFAHKNYWVFYPRYRGTWESGGTFLERSPHEDILDVLDGIPRGFVDAFEHETYHVQPESVYVIGASFGGAAALLASRDERVTASVAISSVIDWQVESIDEPLNKLHDFVRDGFGEGYRFDDAQWQKLAGGAFYNPSAIADSVPGNKVLLIHADDDTIVPIEPAIDFAEKTGATLHRSKKGGHLGLSHVTRFIPYVRMRQFWQHVAVE